MRMGLRGTGGVDEKDRFFEVLSEWDRNAGQASRRLLHNQAFFAIIVSPALTRAPIET